jgi:YbbR domain-containing protein
MALLPLRNLGLMAASLFLGTLLWFTVSGQQVDRSVPRIPVVYRNVPGSLEITGDRLDEVTVQMRGSYNLISAINAANVNVIVDLSDARPGPNVVPLRTDEVVVPLGVQVTQVDPGSATLILEKSGTAQLPVTPRVEGQPAPGFAIGSIGVDPKMVTIAGPESRLKDIASAITERVSVEGTSSTVTQTVSIGVPDNELRLQDVRTARVTVTIVPQMSAGGRTLSGLPVSVRNLAAGHDATIEPAAVTVTVRASAAMLTSLDAARIAPYVDAAGRAPGRHTLPIRVDAGGDFAVSAINPVTVTVLIR